MNRYQRRLYREESKKAAVGYVPAADCIGKEFTFSAYIYRVIQYHPRKGKFTCEKVNAFDQRVELDETFVRHHCTPPTPADPNEYPARPAARYFPQTNPIISDKTQVGDEMTQTETVTVQANTTMAAAEYPMPTVAFKTDLVTGDVKNQGEWHRCLAIARELRIKGLWGGTLPIHICGDVTAIHHRMTFHHQLPHMKLVGNQWHCYLDTTSILVAAEAHTPVMVSMVKVTPAAEAKPRDILWQVQDEARLIATDAHVLEFFASSEWHEYDFGFPSELIYYVRSKYKDPLWHRRSKHDVPSVDWNTTAWRILRRTDGAVIAHSKLSTEAEAPVIEDKPLDPAYYLDQKFVWSTSDGTTRNVTVQAWNERRQQFRLYEPNNGCWYREPEFVHAHCTPAAAPVIREPMPKIDFDPRRYRNLMSLSHQRELVAAEVQATGVPQRDPLRTCGCCGQHLTIIGKQVYPAKYNIKDQILVECRNEACAAYRRTATSDSHHEICEAAKCEALKKEQRLYADERAQHWLAEWNRLEEAGKGQTKAAQAAQRKAQYWLDELNKLEGKS